MVEPRSSEARARTRMGRGSIFPGKVNDSSHRVQAWLTDIGRKRFEEARAHLGDLARAHRGFAPLAISDADTIEYLSRGEVATIKHLRDTDRRRS